MGDQQQEEDLEGAEALVFVYGTLRRGQSNHHWLSDARWLGEQELEGLLLHDLGPFPMAVPGEGRVAGELYAVSPARLAQLDRLEGYPRLYDRRRWPLADGRATWVYVGRRQQVRHAPLLADGVWRGRRDRQQRAQREPPAGPHPC